MGTSERPTRRTGRGTIAIAALACILLVGAGSTPEAIMLDAARRYCISVSIPPASSDPSWTRLDSGWRRAEDGAIVVVREDARDCTVSSTAVDYDLMRLAIPKVLDASPLGEDLGPPMSARWRTAMTGIEIVLREGVDGGAVTLTTKGAGGPILN